MAWFIISFLIIALDQVTKLLIIQNISLNDTVTVINNFFYLTNIRNKGAAWGVLQNGKLFFLIFVPIVTVFLIYYLIKSENRVLKASLSLIIGGALGNFIDRIRLGSVVDFLQFHFGSYIFPNFNAADSFVVIGTALLAYYLLFIYKEKEKEADNI